MTGPSATSGFLLLRAPAALREETGTQAAPRRAAVLIRLFAVTFGQRRCVARLPRPHTNLLFYVLDPTSRPASTAEDA
jgi:hypothetical protein